MTEPGRGALGLTYQPGEGLAARPEAGGDVFHGCVGFFERFDATICNHEFIGHNDVARGETCMPRVRQPVESNETYGR